MQLPPSSAARWRMDVRPIPRVAVLAAPRPLSVTVRESAPSTSTATRHREAPECRTTLVTASEAIRKAATSTAAGSSGSVAASGVDSASRTTTVSTDCSSPSVAVSTSGLAVHTGTSDGVRCWTRSSSSVRT